MSKRKKASPKKHSNTLTYIAWILTITVVVLGSFVAGYYLGYDEAKEEVQKKERMKKEEKPAIIKKSEEASDKKEAASVNDKLKEVLEKEGKTATQEKRDKEEKKEKVKEKEEDKEEKIAEYENASHEVEGTTLPTPPKREIVKISTDKPKLAIIIDDVSAKTHVSAIKGLNLPITMSFLPPSESRPNSHTLASKEDFYMVHLPMEAQNFTKEEPFTLKIGDSQTKISQRIEELKKLFPRVGYINNHTGSKFTADESAMNKLIFTLKGQHITFVDSRTTANSKVPNISKKYGLNYIGRDVFLDHQMDKPYIKLQIIKAIEIAKKHGSAIAIGHPHANTILAINESKQLFKDVELVLVDKL